jgi:DNA-binding GntR family transcriptional regulator
MNQHHLSPAPSIGPHSAPPTRTDWAFSLLRSEILIGELQPGQRLKINELVERYEGLTPTPVREALGRLAELGLVQMTPRRGVRVSTLSTEELEDLFSTRVLLEERAIRLAMANREAGWTTQLDRAFKELERESALAAGAVEPVSAIELSRWEMAHRRFHMALVDPCGSPWLIRLLDIVFENSMRYRYATFRKDSSSFASSMDSHHRIRELALAGDEEGLIEELRRHAHRTVAEL